VSRAVSLGYLTPQQGAVQCGDWIIRPKGQELLANPNQIENWQYATDLYVERPVSVGETLLRHSAALSDRDQIRGAVSWKASATGLQGASSLTILREGPNTLVVPIPGDLLGGTLTLRTVVSVAALDTGRSPLAAHRTGSVLWSDELTVILEGDVSRFPTEALSFRVNGLGSDGMAWRLHVDATDLEAPALSAVRVILNTDHAVYRRLTESAESPEADITRQFLAYDVARQMVEAALTNDELRPIDYGRGSIGATLRARLNDYFGLEGADVEPLRGRWRTSPSEIDAELQAFFGL